MKCNSWRIIIRMKQLASTMHILRRSGNRGKRLGRTLDG